MPRVRPVVCPFCSYDAPELAEAASEDPEFVHANYVLNCPRCHTPFHVTRYIEPFFKVRKNDGDRVSVFQRDKSETSAKRALIGLNSYAGLLKPEWLETWGVGTDLRASAESETERWAEVASRRVAFETTNLLFKAVQSQQASTKPLVPSDLISFLVLGRLKAACPVAYFKYSSHHRMYHGEDQMDLPDVAGPLGQIVGILKGLVRGIDAAPQPESLAPSETPGAPIRSSRCPFCQDESLIIRNTKASGSSGAMSGDATRRYLDCSTCKRRSVLVEETTPVFWVDKTAGKVDRTGNREGTGGRRFEPFDFQRFRESFRQSIKRLPSQIESKDTAREPLRALELATDAAKAAARTGSWHALPSPHREMAWIVQGEQLTASQLAFIKEREHPLAFVRAALESSVVLWRLNEDPGLVDLLAEQFDKVAEAYFDAAPSPDREPAVPQGLLSRISEQTPTKNAGG